MTALQRAVSRLARHLRVRVNRRSSDESGFILLESIIAISLITVIMGAVGAAYVTSLSVSSHEQRQTVAAQLAESTLEQINGLSPGSLGENRAQADVNTEIATLNTYPNAVPSITAANAEYDSTPSGTPTVPATATTNTVGSITFSVWQYLECVSAPTNGVCPSSVGTPNNLKVLVVVTWPQKGCPSSTCAFVTSTVVNTDSDPTFDQKQPAPPTPTGVLQPTSPTATFASTQSSTCNPNGVTYLSPVATGDTVSLPLRTTPGTGVPPYTWSSLDPTTNADTLQPLGLGISDPSGASAAITGTVTAAATQPGKVICTQLTVKDGFNSPSTPRTGTVWIAWTVESAVSAANPGPQANKVGQAANVVLSATNGSGSYTWSATNLPPGLSVNGSTVTGTIARPSPVPNTYSSTVTATDTESCPACATGLHAPATASFNWADSYQDVMVINPPGDQTATNNTTLTAAKKVTMAASGGDGAYTWSAPNLPAGLNIDAGTGVISGTPSVATVPTTKTVTVTVTDSSAGVSPATATFKWTIVAKPTVTAPTGPLKNSIGASVNVAATSTCPDAPCTYSMANYPTGLGINASTGAITGQIASSATSTSTMSVTATDSAGAMGSLTNISWTVVAAPTISTVSPRSFTETVSDSVSVSYACPYAQCTVTLAGAPPGLGLATSPVTTDNSSATSIQANATSNGQLYVTGLVNGNAVTGTATKANYSPTLTITSGDGVAATANNGQSLNWTAYVLPTVDTLTPRNVTVSAADSLKVGYSCPNTNCTISLTSAVPGEGLEPAPASPGDNNTTATTISATSATGYVYITGTVQGSAITGSNATGTANPVLRISDGGNYASPNTNTATWTVYRAPGVTAPGTTQRSTIGGTVSLQLVSSCPNSPCTYTPQNVPDGLTVDGNGLISGTVANTATSTTSARVTITDADGATAQTNPFTWNVFAAPTVSGLSDQNLTVGASYSTKLTYKCPNAACTVTLAGTNSSLGLGLTPSGASGTQTATSISATTVSGGSVYISGTVLASAIDSGNSKKYTPSVQISDGGTFTSPSQSATWYALSSPTIDAVSMPTGVTIGQTVNVAVPYHCYSPSCVINLPATVPGLGLNATASQSGNQTASSVTVSQGVSNVYLTGTVQSGAVSTGNSKAYTLQLNITDSGSYQSNNLALNTTAWVASSVNAMPGSQSVTEGQTYSSAPISYACKTTVKCTLTLNGGLPGLGLSTTANNASATTTLQVSAGTSTVYVTGLVSSTAVSGTALSQTYPAMSLTITDGNGYTPSVTPTTWTAYAPPSVDGSTSTFVTRNFTSGSTYNVAVSYYCPTTSCTIGLTNSITGLGLSTTGGETAANSRASITTSATATTGTFYLSGKVTATSGSKTPTLTITDANGVAVSPSSPTWTVFAAPTYTGYAGQSYSVARNNTLVKTFTYSCPSGDCTSTISGPSWMSFQNQNGNQTRTIATTSGTSNVQAAPPSGTTAKSYTVTLTIYDNSDQSGSSVTYSATWTVT